MLKINKIHFTGIGGVGMSALAQFFINEGAVVSGSDIEKSPMTELLETKGVKVSIGQHAENVPKDADALVYSDAVPKDNVERAEATRHSIPQYSYFQMLGKVSEGKRTVAISGTHGKTTVTAMLGRILRDANVSPTVIVGSIVRDFKSNYLAGASDIFVVEACEYRNHMLELSPEVLVINNLEWDHTDFFPSLESIQESFRKSIAKVPKDGVIITNPSDKNIAPLLSSAQARVVDYTKEVVPELTLPGEFNTMNARAAASAARAIVPEISQKTIDTALASFKGAWRRFEYKGKTKNGADVYDDYAHHPTAILKTIKALRSKTNSKIYVAFHPHLFSRTHDLLNNFAEAFAGADDVIIAPIYGAREVDDGTISNSILAEHIASNGVNARALGSFDEITMYLNDHAQKGDVIMLMGAGDIYKVAETLVR